MLCEACGTCAATKTWVNDRHRVPERHRLCTTCHDLVIEERRTAMGSSKRDPDNAKIANAILRALADSDGLSQQQIRTAINAEPDEHRTINGILTSLGKRGEVSTVNGRYLLTPKGRRQLEPDASPPPVTSPGREAREPGPLWTQAEAAALSDLRAAVERVGIQGRNLFVTYELLTGAREAIEVMEQRSEWLITALRAIEAALPGAPTGLRADAIADRAVSELRSIHNLRRIERLYHDDRAAKERAEAERDKAVADLDKVNAETLDAYEKLEDEHRAEKAAHGETTAKLITAEAEITRLRADLEGANGKVVDLQAAVVTSVDDGPYWTRQGDRHTLSILRPVEVAVLLVDPGSVGWEAGRHTGRVVGSGSEALDLAQRLAEVAAGVRS